MDKLVELFLQSARYDETGEPSALNSAPVDGGHLDEAGIEHGVAAIEKMLTSEDGLRMGAHPPATFVCLAMALEEKPLLCGGAVRCYEKGLEIFDKMRARLGQKGGCWERAVVLQQLSKVCIKVNKPADAARWLEQCSKECGEADGHPRDCVLFGGSFNTQQTRLDFIGTVEKLSAKAYHDLGDEHRSRQHYEEVQRLSRLQSADAVERAVELSEGPDATDNATSAKSAAVEVSTALDPKALWAATGVEQRHITEYRFVDEGPTVALLLDLNDHLGIGEEASDVVDSLKQFRVNCQPTSAEVRCRLQRKDGKIVEFQLKLEPLVNEIVPEDTVPRLKGREGKRRLEVKLFKRDKKFEWRHDLVKSFVTEKPKSSAKASKAPPASAKSEGIPKARTEGTMLNPLTAEELAALPRPSTTGGDNRPSDFLNRPRLLHKEEAAVPSSAVSDNDSDDDESFVQKANASMASSGPIIEELPDDYDEPVVTATTKQPRNVAGAAAADGGAGLKPPPADKKAPVPSWVARVEERHPLSGGLELDVYLNEEAGVGVSMDDLELEGDETAGLRLRLRSAPGSPLELATPLGIDATDLSARWRRKTRSLELRLDIP